MSILFCYSVLGKTSESSHCYNGFYNSPRPYHANTSKLSNKVNSETNRKYLNDNKRLRKDCNKYSCGCYDAMKAYIDTNDGFETQKGNNNCTPIFTEGTGKEACLETNTQCGKKL